MDIESLTKMVGTPRDSAMLRLMLAKLLAADDALGKAELHLERAVDMNPAYAAAWKELGRIRNLAGKVDAAAEAWRIGIQTARENGDKQAEKEMSVFLKRLQRQ